MIIRRWRRCHVGREMTNEMLCEAFYLEKEIDRWKQELVKLKTASLTPQLDMKNTAVMAGKIKDSTGDLASEIADLERKIRKEV